MPWITSSAGRKSHTPATGDRQFVKTDNHTKEPAFFPVFFIHPARERRKNACHFKIGHFQWLEKGISDAQLLISLNKSPSNIFI
jgi:hypothetical protein